MAARTASGKNNNKKAFRGENIMNVSYGNGRGSGGTKHQECRNGGGCRGSNHLNTTSTRKRTRFHSAPGEMESKAESISDREESDTSLQNGMAVFHEENGGSEPLEEPGKQDLKSRLSSYLLALRPWSFSASLTPVMLGCALAYKQSNKFDAYILMSTCLTTLTVHGAGNLVNTYYDYRRGIDRKKCDDRTLIDKRLTPNEVVNFGALLYCLGCCGFGLTTWFSPVKLELMALVFFGGLSSSFLYTGGIGLKYIALGDVAIVITFGPLCVLFSNMAQTGEFSWLPLFYAIPLAMNSEGILHSNNARDMNSDKAAGIVTLAIAIGKTASYILYALLIFLPYSIVCILSFYYSLWFALVMLTLPAAFKLEKNYRSNQMQGLPRQTARVSLFFGIFYVTALLLTDPKKLPGL